MLKDQPGNVQRYTTGRVDRKLIGKLCMEHMNELLSIFQAVRREIRKYSIQKIW